MSSRRASGETGESLENLKITETSSNGIAIETTKTESKCIDNGFQVVSIEIDQQEGGTAEEKQYEGNNKDGNSQEEEEEEADMINLTSSASIRLENREYIEKKMFKTEGEQKYPPWIIDPHFARLKKPFLFWRNSLLLILMGIVIGLANLGYKYAITEAPKAFLTADGNEGYPNDKNTVGFADGKLWWIAIGAGTGFVNAVAKLLMKLGNHVGFMGAIQMQKSDPLESLKVVICAIISLAGGCSLGPEAGLAAIGGGIAAFTLRILDINDDRRQKTIILAGMSAGFTGFLPSPLLAVMMTWELGIPPAFWGMNQVHALTLFTMASVPAAAVFFALEKTTIYDPLNLAIPDSLSYQPSKWEFAVGILFGVMGACLAICYYLICNLVKLCFKSPKAWAKRCLGTTMSQIVINTFGGVCYGILGYLFPLTVGDGAFQLQGVISSGEQIGSSILAASCFVNILTYWICMETGFVGGIFTPMLVIGNMLGGVFANVTNVNGAVAISCSFISLASAVIPAPLFLVLFASSLFGLGARGLIPITTCAFTSHLLIEGTGLLPLLSDPWQKAKQWKLKRAKV